MPGVRRHAPLGVDSTRAAQGALDFLVDADALVGDEQFIGQIGDRPAAGSLGTGSSECCGPLRSKQLLSVTVVCCTAEAGIHWRSAEPRFCYTASVEDRVRRV